jgi:hypothetical protein
MQKIKILFAVLGFNLAISIVQVLTYVNFLATGYK